jgi:hypothetical protein
MSQEGRISYYIQIVMDELLFFNNNLTLFQTYISLMSNLNRDNLPEINYCMIQHN